MTTNSRVALIGVIIIAIVIIFAFMHRPASSPVVTTTTEQPVATAVFSCNASKAITASFYNGTSTPVVTPGQPPVPTGHVELSLSDGRTMSLAQTISADGARYASAGESTVFWNKGNGVTFTENGQQTYMGCIVTAKDPGGLTQVYSNGTKGFSIRYPLGFTLNESYKYQELGPGKDIGGVKFTIPASMATGTNLGSDSYISVEEIPQAKTCSAGLFIDPGTKVQTVTDGNTTYSFASTTGAGAGNRYEETIYAIPGTNPCIAVRYFIHYSVFENYPTGTVTRFDQQALINQFDSIRRTLVIAQ